MSKKSILDMAQEIAEEFGTTPLRILMHTATTDPDDTRRLQAAIAAAPYVHPKLKQVEVDDHRDDKRTPREIEADIVRILTEIAGDAPREGQRDLIGPDTGAGAVTKH